MFVQEIAICFVGLRGNSEWPNHNRIGCVVLIGNFQGMKYTCIVPVPWTLIV